MNSFELKVNMIAQKMIDISDGTIWFNSLKISKQKYVLKTLQMCCIQAHPRTNEIDDAISKSELKATYTPCVIIKKEGFQRRLKQIIELPSEEYQKSFILLVTLLAIADKRRRETECKNGCTHDWHNINKIANNSFKQIGLAFRGFLKNFFT